MTFYQVTLTISLGLALQANAAAPTTSYVWPGDVWKIPLGITAKELVRRHAGIRPVVLSLDSKPDETINTSKPELILVGPSKSSLPDVILNPAFNQ